MKRIGCLLTITFFLVPLLGAGSSPGGSSLQAGDSHQSGEPASRPTLGASSSPNKRATQTATVIDFKKLARIRSIYIEKMDNALSEKLIQSLGKLGSLKIVSKPKEADAIMTGSCLESRRLKRLHSEVFIADRGGASIWQDNLYRPYNPPTLEQAVNDTAQIVVEHLAESLVGGK